MYGKTYIQRNDAAERRVRADASAARMAYARDLCTRLGMSDLDQVEFWRIAGRDGLTTDAAIAELRQALQTLKGGY